MYSYATDNLEDDIRHRLNDLRPGLDQRYSDTAIRAAIIKGLRWADPLGELVTFDMTAISYNAGIQMLYELLEILQIETRAPNGPQVIVPPSLWNFQRGQDRPLRLTYPPTVENLVITGMVQNTVGGMENPEDTISQIKIDPILIELYATAYLYERESQWNAPGSISSEMNRASDYRIQAETRKAQMLEEIRSVYRAIPVVEGDQPMQQTAAKRPAARRRT